MVGESFPKEKQKNEAKLFAKYYLQIVVYIDESILHISRQDLLIMRSFFASLKTASVTSSSSFPTDPFTNIVASKYLVPRSLTACNSTPS